MNSNDFLMDKGLVITDTKEYALSKEDSIHYINLLNNENKIILGGDVYSLDINTKELLPTYDNWYISNIKLNESNGYTETKEYIERYRLKDNIYFVIVSK